MALRAADTIPNMAPTLTIKAKQPAKQSKAKKQYVSSPTRTPWVQALVDPFTADSVQLPDEYAGGSVSLKLYEDYTVTLSAAGDFVCSVATAPIRSFYTTTISAGAITAVAYVAHTDYADFLAQFSHSRILLQAVEVNYIGSELDNQGRLAVVCSPDQAYVTVGATVATVFDDSANALPLREGALVVARPVQPPRFEATNAVALGIGTVPSVNIAVVGGKPSATVLHIRCIKFMEALPTKGSLHRGGATTEPYDPSAMAIAANMAMNEPPVHPNTDGGRSAIVSEARELADTAASWLIAAAQAAGLPGASGARVVYETAKAALQRRKSK